MGTVLAVAVIIILLFAMVVILVKERNKPADWELEKAKIEAEYEELREMLRTDSLERAASQARVDSMMRGMGRFILMYDSINNEYYEESDGIMRLPIDSNIRRLSRWLSEGGGTGR